MRIPNCECIVCGKPLYRRPFELKKVRYVACMMHRAEAQKKAGVTDAQFQALSLGREKGTNHLEGIPKSIESNEKRSAAHKRWCRENPEKVKARGRKTQGPNHYNWKGGSSRLNTSIRTMSEHRKWMDAVKARDGYCIRCGSIQDLESHHIVELSVLLDLHGVKNRDDARACLVLWDIANGETLCGPCHCDHHGREYVSSGNGRRKQLK